MWGRRTASTENIFFNKELMMGLLRFISPPVLIENKARIFRAAKMAGARKKLKYDCRRMWKPDRSNFAYNSGAV